MKIMRSALLIFIWMSLSAYALGPSEMEADLKANPGHLNTRIELANYYLKQKSFAKVVELLNAYTDQLNSSGFLALANAYSNRKEYLDEVRVLNLLTQKEPEDFHWHFLLGQAYLKEINIQGDITKKKDLVTSAIQSFRKALSIQPDYKPAFDVLLTTFLQQKNNNEARELIQDGISKYGARPELLHEICRLDSMDGFLDSALKSCREAIKLSPDFPDNYVFLIQALNDIKEEKKADADAVAAAKKFPKSEFVQWAAGTLFFKRNNSLRRSGGVV